MPGIVPEWLWPTAPWMPKEDIPPDLLIEAYENCQRGEKSYCINSNVIRACAKELERTMGRETRYIQTYDGYLWWSEYIEGYGWNRFRAPLSADYAAKIDIYDSKGKNFKFAKAADIGQTEYIEPCSEYIAPSLEVREARRERYFQRKAEGKVKKLRDRQLPKVLERVGQ